MGKQFLSILAMAAFTAVISLIAFHCEVRSGANRGLVYAGGEAYYYDDVGEEVAGFVLIPEDSTVRYFDEDTHTMVKGEIEISGNRYLFDKDGVMQTGFQTDKGNTRYFIPGSGLMKTGWMMEGKDAYYFDPETGYMVTGWKEINDHKFYFGEDGKMVRGVFNIDGGVYFADVNTGIIALGLTKIGSKYFYFDKVTGNVKKGWVDADGEKYFFNEQTGEGINGIIEMNGSKYGFVDGKMVRNKRAVANNHLYYFGDDGKITREIDGTKKMVAITYDDGPSEYTNTIIDVFEKYNQKCTFFIVGNRIKANEKVVKREGELGYQQGSHTFGHNVLTGQSAAKQKANLKKVDDELIRVTGKPSVYFRPPEGRWNNALKKSCGCPVILWSVDTRDWESRNQNSVYNAVIGKVKDGDIVLMHDLYESTANATKRIVPALVDAGFQLVTVEEMGLLKQGGLKNGTVYYSIGKK